MRPNRLAAADVLLATGVGLLAAAAVAAGTHPASRVKDGGTLRLNVSATDVQSIDPALDYEFIVSSHVGCYLFQEAQAAMDLAHVCLK